MTKKTIESIFNEYIYLNRKEILDTGWTTLYLTDTAISDYVFYRDYGETVQFLYLYSGMSLIIPQEYMKTFFMFQSTKYEEIICKKPESSLDAFILGMSKVSRIISRKLCNDDPLELLEIIKDLCTIGTEEFRETYSFINFDAWRLRNILSEKEI